MPTLCRSLGPPPQPMKLEMVLEEGCVQLPSPEERLDCGGLQVWRHIRKASGKPGATYGPTRYFRCNVLGLYVLLSEIMPMREAVLR